MKWKLRVGSLKDNPTNDRKNIGQKPYGLNLKEVKIVFPIYRNFQDEDIMGGILCPEILTTQVALGKYVPQLLDMDGT